MGEKSHSAVEGREPFSQREVRERGRKQEREKHIVHTRHCGVGICWITLGENIPFPGVYLEQGILPLNGQRILQVPLSSHSIAGDRGLHKRQITCLQLSTLL